MTLFVLIAALLLEQLRPLFAQKYFQGWLVAYVDYFQHHFNSGEYGHSKTAWWLAVFPLSLVAVLLYWGVYYLSPLLSIFISVLVLYFCMGFGKYSQCFKEIQQALRSNQLDEARTLLSGLSGINMRQLNSEEIARVTIEISVIKALRHLFGVIVWFSMFSLLGLGGAAGALLYRIGWALRTHWTDKLNADELAEAKFDAFSQEMFHRLEWLPIRLTAATFAVVGNFEDTVYCWRSQASSWQDSEAGILLASAAGASGIRLGAAIHQAGGLLIRPELGAGEKTGDMALQCTIRLMWRSVMFMLLILFMLTLAGLLR